MKILLLEHPRVFNRSGATTSPTHPVLLLSGYAAGTLAAAGHDVAIVEATCKPLYETIRKDRHRRPSGT